MGPRALLIFFGVLFTIVGIVVIIRKKGYQEDIENVPPGREQLTVTGRVAVWSGIGILIIGIALLLTAFLTNLGR
jgi:uncharacterized membrane protein